MRVVQPDAEGLAIAAGAIRAGEIVAYPTETVYGLAVDPFNERAVERLFAAKGRPDSNPIPLIIDDPERVTMVAATFSDAAKRYADAFWPGPLSLILPRAATVPDRLTGGTESICVRCPGSKIARALCHAAGGVLTSTSANTSGKPPALSIEDIGLDDISIGVDGGRLNPSLPSTIIDPETGTILRIGALLEAVIRAQFPV